MTRTEMYRIGLALNGMVERIMMDFAIMRKGEQMSLINREDLIAEYDRVHVGPPGGARKLMEDAPTVELVQKTGVWKKVYGYATPGGDPVWCCSECGKGLHVYGVEHGTYGKDIADHQWVACPNCGTKMIGENY